MFTKLIDILHNFILFFSVLLLPAASEAVFGYMEYTGYNIGDDIQSLAARCLLPKNTVPLHRDLIHQFYQDEEVHTLMNGWFMQTKNTGWPYPELMPPEKSWPPSSSVDPLFVSFHLTEAFLSEAFSEEGIAYFKQHAPIGARDYWTMQALLERGVPAYFSGCLTLTLQNHEKQRDHLIYAVDLDDECVAFIRAKTQCPVVRISHIIDEGVRLDQKQRERIANDLLNKYRRAQCVITSRLYAALPCLAFQTPVLLINTQSDQYRFDGLKQLVRNCSKKQFLSGMVNFNVNKPPANPKTYLSLRENLIKTVQEWVERHQPKVEVPPSLHLLIATTGRKSLFRMLDQLGPQLNKEDYLTVVFDGRDDDTILEQVQKLVSCFKSTSTVIFEPVNLGYWGHGIRNRYNNLLGDFVMHGDDDDCYTPDALDVVRHYCRNKETLYIFKMALPNKETLWNARRIALGEIGTPMGVVPSYYNSQALWGYRYGGDFDFYHGLEGVVPKVEYVDQVIYEIRPDF